MYTYTYNHITFDISIQYPIEIDTKINSHLEIVFLLVKMILYTSKPNYVSGKPNLSILTPTIFFFIKALKKEGKGNQIPLGNEKLTLIKNLIDLFHLKP